MEVRSDRLISLKALIVHNSACHVGVVNDSISNLINELNNKDITTVFADSAEDAAAVLHNDATIELVLLDWVMSNDEQQNESAKKVIKSLRSKSQAVPLFLLLDNRQGENLTHEIMRETDELIWIQEDTPFFLAGRVHSAILSYREKIVPPLTRAIFEFAQKYEYSWHTPGHAGGTAFMKSAVGRAFHDYCAPTSPYPSASWARFSITAARLVKAKNSAPECLGQTALIPSLTAPQCRTA